MPNYILFKNASILNPAQSKTITPGCNVLVAGNKIREIKQSAISCSNAKTYDLAGKILMPGLIDAHAHVTGPTMNPANDDIPESEIILQAAQYLENMLQRGFTSIREAGGAGYGLAKAINVGLIKSPRLFYSVKALTQTGGGADFRNIADNIDEPCMCAHQHSASTVGLIADGISEVRKAAREALRLGATQIKIMASGRILFPSVTGRVAKYNYSKEEIRAIVEEAEMWGTYVMAHAYTNESVKHAVECGVRSIEHALFLDDETAAFMASKNAFMVPTLVTIKATAELSKNPAVNKERLYDLMDSNRKAIQIARKHGVKIGLGTDLWGVDAHKMQLQEFLLRAPVDTPFDTIYSATAVNAELLNHSGKLGVIVENAFADLIVLEGNPLEDIHCLVEPETHLKLVMKDGVVYKDTLP